MEHIQNYTFREVLEQPHKNVTPSYSRGIFALLKAQSLMSVIYQVNKAAYHERQCYSTADNKNPFEKAYNEMQRHHKQITKHIY